MDSQLQKLKDLQERLDAIVPLEGARTADDVTYPLIRKIPKFFLKHYASWMAGQMIPDLNSGLRVMRRNSGRARTSPRSSRKWSSAAGRLSA